MPTWEELSTTPPGNSLDWDSLSDKPPEKSGVLNEIGRGLKHGVQVTLPKSIGQALQFAGQEGSKAQEVGRSMVENANARENTENQESAYGQSLTSPLSVRGNVYEAADNSVLSVAPGAAGAAAGAGIGAFFGGVGAAPGALIGYGIGSIAALPIFYGSQGQQSYENIKAAQLKAGVSPEEAELAARKGGHASGAIEAGGEAVADLIPLHSLFKPFAKATAKAGGNMVKGMLIPTAGQFVKTVGKTEAGEVLTEMAQQAGEDAVEGYYGSGPGATLENTSRVIMPTALMSLIPGAAGAGARHVQMSRMAEALQDPATPEEDRTKIAASMVSAMGEESPEKARAFSLYAGVQISNGAPIEIKDDSFYERFAHEVKGGQVEPERKPDHEVVSEIQQSGSLDDAIQRAADSVADPSIDADLVALLEPSSQVMGQPQETRAAAPATSPAQVAPPIQEAPALDQAIQRASQSIEAPETGAVAKTDVDTGLIVTAAGVPYKTESGAALAMRTKGPEFTAIHQVVPHPDGGFAIAKNDTQPAKPDNGAVSQPAPTGLGGTAGVVAGAASLPNGSDVVGQRMAPAQPIGQPAPTSVVPVGGAAEPAASVTPQGEENANQSIQSGSTAAKQAAVQPAAVEPAGQPAPAQAPVTPNFGTNSAGKITLRGVPMERIQAVRDKLKLKNVIIGKDNAVFPKGTDLKALQAEFGVVAEKQQQKAKPEPLPAEERARRAPILKNAKALGIKTVARPFSEIEKEVLASHEAEHARAVDQLSDAEYQQLDDAATALMDKIAGADEKAQAELHETIAALQKKYRGREYYEALTNYLEGLQNESTPEETGRAESGAGDHQEAGRGEAKPAAEPAAEQVAESSSAQAENVKQAESKKLEVLKAQAAGKISGDQGAALKELADAGEHAAVDEVLRTSLAANLENAENLKQESEKSAAQAKPVEKSAENVQIEDFGEKLGGARKDLAAAIKQEYSDSDIASLPLSKIWPADLAEKIEDKFVAAFAFAARQEIPAKPRVKYKVDSWVKKVKILRDLAGMMMDSATTRIKAEALLKETKALDGFNAKISLLESIDREQWKRIGKVHEYPDAYTYENVAAAAAESSKAADDWLRDVSGRVAKLKEDNARLLMAAGVTEQFDKSLASGKITQEQYDAALKKGTILPSSEMQKAASILAQIEEARNTKLEVPQTASMRKIPAPQVTVEIDGKRERFEGAKSVGEVIDQVNEKLGVAAKGKRMEFEVRGRAGAYFINKKGDPLYRKLKTFTDSKDAMAFKYENYDELVAAWEAVKDSDNVKESDLRTRENRERTAEDWRKGKDVTPEQFISEFGFRGVEFGLWVKQGKNAKERQGMLNAAYDALMDLSNIINVPPKALSLEGTLGLGFGSRGSGAASAHFEPDTLVINLTKTRGAGTLAHEWFHAMDNYFQLKRGKPATWQREEGYITYNPENYYIHKRTGFKLPERAFNKMIQGERHPEYGILYGDGKDRANWVLKEGVRPEVGEAFADLVKALNDSPMAKRASLIDKGKSGGYWSRIIERGARSFENYVIHKMMLNGYHNDYLANVTPANEFQRDAGRYPYLLEGEIEPVAEAFDTLFQTIKTKETDKGTAMFSRAKSSRGLSVSAVESIANPIAEKLKNIRTVKVVARQNEIPGLKEQIDAAYSKFQNDRTPENMERYLAVAKDDIEGAYVNGELYLVASNLGSAERVEQVLRHEVAHLSVEQMLEEVKPGLYGSLLKNVRMLDKAGNKYIRELAESVDRTQPGLDADTRAAEIIAQIAERGDHQTDMPGAVRSLWQRLTDGIKAFYKLVFGDKLNDQDVRDIVEQSFRWARGEGDAARMYGGTEKEGIQASRGEQRAESFARLALEELAAENDALFAHKKSVSKTLTGVIADVVSGSEYLGDLTREDERAESEADHRYAFKTANDKLFYVYEKDNGEIWIDVSRLDQGSGGAAIYAAMGNYAYNTGKRFIGDPFGLSPEAVVRRTHHMLSSALRFGTTRHLDAAKQQVWGAPEDGVVPLEWKGSDIDKVEAMIDTIVETSEAMAPSLKEYHYDFQRSQFSDAQGRPVTGAAMAANTPRDAGIGEKTARRVVLLRSLLDADRAGSSGGRSGILEKLLSYDNSSLPESMRRLFSRRADGDVDSGNIASRARSSIVGDSGRKYTPAQQKAMERTGSVVTKQSLKDTLSALWQDAGKKAAQGIVDQFRPVRDIDTKAYTLLRLSKGATGAFEAMMHYGKLKIVDGATDADQSGGVLDRVFYPIGKESTDFLRWVAGNRAERLKGIGREHLFTDDDIAAFKSLADGETDFDYTMPDGTVTRDRAKIYTDTLKKFNEFNRNVLDIAQESGLIDSESRALWEHEFYVPFYRVSEDEKDSVRSMNIKGGVVRQEAFKKLKGGKDQLNDLMANTLMNWAHLIDASAKNRAAKATIEAAEKVGSASPAVAGDKHTVWYMDKGKKVEYQIDDPYLMVALNSLEYAGMRNPAMNAMSTMKHWLTVGVTASPFFKVRNLVRDSVQAIATADLNYNPAGNVKEGFKLTDKKNVSQKYVSALAGGGLIRFGTMLEGNEASRVRQLIKKGARDEYILDSESKVRAMYDKYLDPAISAYNELGNRGEEVTRMALYSQLIDKGMSHADASLMARDLMDFSMQGAWTSVRFLTQVVPFMNARLQGLYKLGRSANEDKVRFMAVTGAVAMASLALLWVYGDDDDWKKREDWDRDNYWWFKIGGVAFRIPKPFEIGAIATLAERSWEYTFDDEMTDKRFAATLKNNLSNQLSMNPIPQLVKPIIDVYSNIDSFTGRPIETMGMEKLAPDYRYNQNTSMVARGISTAGNAATFDNFLSPVQVDHMLRGYFGWLGSFCVGGADMMVRSVMDEPTKPAVDYWKLATGGIVADLDGAQSRYVSQMYEQAKELEQAYGTYRNLMKQGKIEDAAEYRADHADELKKYKNVEIVKKAIAKLNERIKLIERSGKDPEEKRAMINQLRGQQDKIARVLH